MVVIDLMGKKFGRLTVISRADNSKQGQAMWLCMCDCGTKHTVKSIILRRGISKSCGCLEIEARYTSQRTHGHTSSGTSPTFHSWAGMISRCTNEHHVSYPRYGGRGISVTERWHSFQNFLDDMGVKPDGFSLDRINNSLSYSPENCKWSDAIQQARNKSNNHLISHNGETKCLQEWADLLGISGSSLRCRLSSGWSIHDALTTKKQSSNRKHTISGI
jgi:hypothetical protein